MSDLIRRQDAIDALGEEPPVWYDGEDEIAERNQWRRDKAAIESLPSADRPTGWIPVSERLPIPPAFCLVTTDGSHNDVIDIALYMSDGWHKASEVIAWMPLPKPYREEMEEYELATEQMEHDAMYEPTYNSEDGSM